MQIEIKVDKNCKELKVIVVAGKITGEVNDVVKKLSEDTPQRIVGFRDSRAAILNEADLYRVYSASGKIHAVTSGGEYILHLRLYELEQKLDRRSFVRISNSEIVNLNQVKSFDLSFTGTICIRLSDGTVSYVSRRYVSKIKQVLGI